MGSRGDVVKFHDENEWPCARLRPLRLAGWLQELRWDSARYNILECHRRPLGNLQPGRRYTAGTTTPW